LQTVRAQTRVATAGGIWLDLIAHDYFGGSLRRRPSEPDIAFSIRIRKEFIRERCTRKAVSSALVDLTARSPIIFEPANTADTGGYGARQGAGGGIAYGLAGGWGNLHLPLQFFVTTFRPIGGGIASVSGWGCGAGGYGEGTMEYAALSMMELQITDADIYLAIAQVLPIGTIAWARIST
jgi:hypothetical protein